jgi:hypothetical protein
VINDKINKIIVSVTDRVYNKPMSYSGQDEVYRSELASIIQEVVSVAGPVTGGADYPTFASGQGWAFKFGQPRDHQTHYVEFLREEDAVFYMLKYGGTIIPNVEEVGLGYAE